MFSILYTITGADFDDLLVELPIPAGEDDSDVVKVIPHEQLTIENVVYWKSLIELVQNSESYDDRLGDVICDLSTFCTYVEELVHR